MKSIKGGKHPAKSNETHEMLKQIADMLPMLSKPGKPAPNTTGVSYSDMLLKLIKPYQQSPEKATYEEFEYLLDIASAAWNLSVCKNRDPLVYEVYKIGIKEATGLDRTEEKLLKKLVADKEKFFGQYNERMIHDFEIVEEKSGMTKLNVITKTFEDAIQDALSGGLNEDMMEEDEDLYDDFEYDEDAELDEPYMLPVVNRNAVAIKPRQPFIDWIHKINPPEDEAARSAESNMYLLPEVATEKERLNYIKKNFDRIFGSELLVWEDDQEKWPQNRTYKMFTEWFEVSSSHDLVLDLVLTPLDRD